MQLEREEMKFSLYNRKLLIVMIKISCMNYAKVKAGNNPR